MLISVSLVFFLSWGPLNVMNLFLELYRPFQVNKFLFDMHLWTAFFLSCMAYVDFFYIFMPFWKHIKLLGPIIYIVFSFKNKYFSFHIWQSIIINTLLHYCSYLQLCRKCLAISIMLSMIPPLYWYLIRVILGPYLNRLMKLKCNLSNETCLLYK